MHKSTGVFCDDPAHTQIASTPSTPLCPARLRMLFELFCSLEAPRLASCWQKLQAIGQIHSSFSPALEVNTRAKCRGQTAFTVTLPLLLYLTAGSKVGGLLLAVVLQNTIEVSCLAIEDSAASSCAFNKHHQHSCDVVVCALCKRHWLMS